MKKLLFTLILTILISLGLSAQYHGFGCINGLERIPLASEDQYKPSSKPSTNLFPMFGKLAKENNRTFPLPFGVSLHTLFYDQGYTASNLFMTSDSNDLVARADTLYQNTTAYEMRASIRPNVWLLPFLNIYGIFGYTKGVISPDLVVPYIVIENIPIFDSIVVDTTFEIKDEIGYIGPTYGIGATLSIGYKFFFVMADYNYSVTNPTDLDDNLHNHFFSPKAGIFFGKQEKTLWSFWLGAMYIKNDQAFQGRISVADIDEAFVPLFGEEASYQGEITANERWNFVFGGALVINQKHNITIEAGLFSRKQIALGYNFSF